MTQVKNNRLLAIFWTIAWVLISDLNDVLLKLLGHSLSVSQLIFLRYAFASIVLLPIILYKGRHIIYTRQWYIYILRAALLYIGMILWAKGLKHVDMAVAITIVFAIPFINLILCIVFLKEKFTWLKLITIAICFIGILVTTRPFSSDFNIYVLLLLASTIFFATLDLINKKYIGQDNNITLLFLTAIFTTIIAFPASINEWQPLSDQTILYLIFLGIGANVILFCIIKAFSYAEASFIAPFRYLELVFATIFGYFIFNEIPDIYKMIGMVIVIMANIALFIKEEKN